MSSSDNPYSRNTVTNNTFYGDDIIDLRSEPDMRQEMIHTLDGHGVEIAKGQYVLLRKMNRDENGSRTLCNCVDPITKESDKDRYCPICMSCGYIWTETLLKVYKNLENSDKNNTVANKITKPGLINIPLVVFYTRYNTNILLGDKIVEVKLNNDGTIYTPYKREAIYRVASLANLRSDEGKFEYSKLFTYLEDVKHLNKPRYTEV